MVTIIKTSISLEHHAKNGKLHLIYNESADGLGPFDWPDGVLLTEQAFNRFNSLATAFELATCASAPIDAGIAALGNWKVLTTECINELALLHGKPLNAL